MAVTVLGRLVAEPMSKVNRSPSMSRGFGQVRRSHGVGSVGAARQVVRLLPSIAAPGRPAGSATAADDASTIGRVPVGFAAVIMLSRTPDSAGPDRGRAQTATSYSAAA